MKPAELLPRCVRLRGNTVKVPGVYVIFCRTSGMAYIGSSQHVYRRLSAHHAYLNGGRHTNAHLQAAWKRYGAEAFDLLLVEARAGTQLELLALENAYLAAVDRDMLFNSTVPATLGREPGFKHGAEAVEKIRARHRGNTYNLGRKQSEEQKAALSKRSQGHTVSEEQRRKVRASHKANPPNAKLSHDVAAKIRRQFEAACVSGRPPWGHLREAGAAIWSERFDDGAALQRRGS